MITKKYLVENDMDLKINPNDLILNDDDFINNEISIDANGYYFGDKLSKKQELHNFRIDEQLNNE